MKEGFQKAYIDLFYLVTLWLCVIKAFFRMYFP